MRERNKFIVGVILGVGILLGGILSYPIGYYLEYESLDSKIQALMNEYQIPSLAACIVINDSLIYINGHGEQAELNTVYMIGSITKSFTATAILQLKEENLINLDANISNYLPFNVQHPLYPERKITPRMLLTHTSGLAPNLIWSLEYYLSDQMISWINQNLGWEIIPWDKRPTLKEFLNGSLNPGGAYYEDYNWQYRPGSTFLYSNAGYQLLGYLIEHLTNQSLESYMQEHVFDPIGMTNTGYNYQDFIDHHAIPYEWNNTNIAFPLYNINVTGAGSIRSTITDMTKYLIAFMNQGVYKSAQILNPSSVQLMQSKQITLGGGSVEGFSIEGYGLGWYLYYWDTIGHGGATPGYCSNLFFKKIGESTYGVMLMFNRGTALIYDELLVNEFIPAINLLMLQEAESYV